MIKIDDNTKIYIMPGYTDLRLGIDGYAHIVQLDFNNDPLDGSLYIFCNKNRDKIKILQFEYDGFWLYYKRLEDFSTFFCYNIDVKINREMIKNDENR